MATTCERDVDSTQAQDGENDASVYVIEDADHMYHPFRCCKVREAENEEKDIRVVTNPDVDKKCYVCGLFNPD